MNQALLSGIASKAYDKLLKAAESKQPIAVTGLPDTMAAYIASKLCADTGKKVLLISGNDLKAAHDAEDGQQLLETGVACLPGGEIDLTRGASSHESAWRRLEALARAQEGDIRLLAEGSLQLLYSTLHVQPDGTPAALLLTEECTRATVAVQLLPPFVWEDPLPPLPDTPAALTLQLTMQDVMQADTDPAALGRKLAGTAANKRWLHHPKAETFLAERVALLQRVYKR